MQEAQDMRAHAALVARLNFCVWTEASVGAVEMTRWDACAAPPQILAGATVYGGLDLATTTDLTALVLMREAPDGYLDLLARFWCPAEGIATRARRDHVPYELWAREGWIIPTPGNVTDYDRVREDIKALTSTYRLAEIAYDRWNATQLVTQLMGDGAMMVPIGQGYGSMTAPTKEWLARIASGKLRHGGNPVLRWMAANLVVEQDAAGNFKPSKARSTERIDGMVAAIMALSQVVVYREQVAAPGFLTFTQGLAAALPELQPSADVAQVAAMCAVRTRVGAVIGLCSRPAGHAGGHAP